MLLYLYFLLLVKARKPIDMYWLLTIGLCLLIDKSLACTIPAFANLTVQSNFSLHHFLGVWYEIKWLPTESDLWQDFSQSFELQNNSNQQIFVHGKARLPYEQKCFSFGPWLILANNGAKMILEKKNLNNTISLNWPYYIVKTDYNHYALIYGCMSKNFTHEDQCEEPILWIFSRTIVLSNEYLTELDDYIENILCINLTKLHTTLHGEKSCYISSSFGLKMYLIDIKLFLISLSFIFISYIYI